MYLEYDWTFDVYRPRFGKTFIDLSAERDRGATKLNVTVSFTGQALRTRDEA